MRRFSLYAALLVVGAGWGLTLPLMRIAVSTGYRPLGLLFWQSAIMAALLLALMLTSGRPLPPLRRNFELFSAVALFGAVLPGYFSFLTADDLPAGVRAIIIALVPMFTLPMALAAGFERPAARRALGVVLGAAAIAIIATPGAEITPHVGLGVLVLALISPVSYGIEATYLAWRGQRALHPIQLLLGASLVGTALSLMLAVGTDQMALPTGFGRAEWAVLLAGMLNVMAYTGYVWLIGQAGSVFASQIAYLVTGSGVLWSRLILGETYAPPVWIAFGVILAAIALVQPLGSPAEKA